MEMTAVIIIVAGIGVAALEILRMSIMSHLREQAERNILREKIVRALSQDERK